MAQFRSDPYGAFNYLVDLGSGDPGGTGAGFSEVILPHGRVQLMEYRNGSDKLNAPRKLVGTTSFTNCILKRGIVGDLGLFQ